ncbi:MAG: PLP-dependent cysteine synthase family protein [Candidatus Baldrarchaeia archaeon]
MRIFSNMLEMIGNTPLLKLTKVTKGLPFEVWAKAEFLNPSGSVKDRIALYMIRAAEKSGKLKPGMTLVVPTTGNTGIAFAAVGSYLGYKVMIVIPEEMSEERMLILRAYGAELVHTPGGESDVFHSLEYSKKLAEEHPDKYCFFDQWSDEENVKAHYETTGREILEQTEGRIDAFVAGVGTGGTLIGIAKRLKEYNSNIYVVGMEPAECPTISLGKWGRHEIEGIGDGFVPEIIKRYRHLVDEWMLISSDEAIRMARRLAREEGLFLGISSGANVLAAIRLGQKLGLNNGQKVVTILPDYGARYLSTRLVRENK